MIGASRGSTSCMAVCMVTAALLHSVLSDLEPPAGAPVCRDPRCRFLRDATSHTIGNYKHLFYEVEGNTIEIEHFPPIAVPTSLTVTCTGDVRLDSSVMPRFESAQYVERLTTIDCPLPATKSIQEALAALNMSVCEPKTPSKWCRLEFYDLPSTAPPLTSKHFTGLERVESMTLTTAHNMRASAAGDFLKPLTNLKYLDITHVTLAAGSLDAAPASLETLELELTGTERLPETIYSSPTLRTLTVQENNPLDAVSVPPGVHDLTLKSSATTLRLDSGHTLRTLRLDHWTELMPSQIKPCGELRQIYLTAPAMLALPEFWLRNCSGLEELYISEARNLTALPWLMFRDGSRFKTFSLTGSALKTLPGTVLTRLFELQTLQLNNNRIESIPSDLFSDIFNNNILILDLSSNNLDGSVFEALERLQWTVRKDGSVKELDLSGNPRIGDVCDADGYSLIRDMRSLRKLGLSETGVSRICKDWRENMPELKLLDLRNTNISELLFEDLQFKRNLKSEVLLQGAPVSAVKITRETYNQALSAPASFTSMNITAELECDCRLYWTRRALEPYLHALDSIRELRCIGGGLLSDQRIEKMVCPAPKECAAALPSGSECFSRPEDNLLYDRCLVRARWEKSSQRLVPRRIYPFYPIHKLYSQGFYIKQNN